jgi:hypothetical protein
MTTILEYAPGADVTIGPNNSPYQIPGPAADYGTVTIQPGGWAQLSRQTKLTIATLKRP